MKPARKISIVGIVLVIASLIISPLYAESPSEEEIAIEEETFPDEEVAIEEEALPDEEIPEDDESLYDDDYLMFEAPPLVFEAAPIYELRSFDDIFPGLLRNQRRMAMSIDGLRNSFTKEDSPILFPNPDTGINLISSVMSKNPSHIIEILLVVPYEEKELDMLDVYNALGSIGDIKNHTILLNSGREFNIFVESTRLAGAKNRKSIPDPPPATFLPFSETIYLRLKEFYFGNLFLKGDISISPYGVTYSMTNFTDIRFFLLPVMKAERFTALIYLEPVKEGVLIYSMSGLYIPGFLTEGVNLTPSINSRIGVLINWITDNLKKQGNMAVEQENEVLVGSPER